MSKKIGVAGIGIGSIWNWGHSPAWLANPDVELVAVCDVVRSKAEEFAKAHQIPHVFESYRELLKRPEIDAIDICTSNLHHSEIAVAALKAGKHVFCEKPDAINVAEARRMAEAAQASGKTLMCMRNNRFTPTSQFLKRYVDSEQVGEIYTGRCGWLRRRRVSRGWFTNKALSGGGPLIDLGVHYIDLAMWLMGNPKPVAVSGATYSKFGAAASVQGESGKDSQEEVYDVEDLATGFVRFANGSTLQIEFSWAGNIEEEQIFLELRGTRAGFSIKNGDLKLFSEVAGSLVDLKPRLTAGGNAVGHAGHLNHFIDVIQKKAEPINSPSDGVDMISLLCAIYESAKRGQEIRIS